MTSISNPRHKKPNYNLIHAKPLPLIIQPYPPLIPHNPISILHIIFTYFFCRTPCVPDPLYTAKFSPGTRSVNVTDPRSVLALWNDGFFGKGSLSRSEPTWLSRRRRALGILGTDEALTAEEITERRRKERKEFKAERARVEKERLQSILAQEGKLDSLSVTATASETGSVRFATPEPREEITPLPRNPVAGDVENLEHLQLMFVEAFFLVYGLGVLEISGPDNKPLNSTELFRLFRQFSHSPPLNDSASLQPDDTFLLNYVVYHHFRSLGWVVRSGVKFGVEFLLYNRGPAFTHAEFAILILPSYSHPAWDSDTKRKNTERKPWHWLHCVNRVSAQVKKTVILVYVDIPPHVHEDMEIGHILKQYKIREFSLRRWLVSRNRD